MTVKKIVLVQCVCISFLLSACGLDNSSDNTVIGENKNSTSLHADYEDKAEMNEINVQEYGSDIVEKGAEEKKTDKQKGDSKTDSKDNEEIETLVAGEISVDGRQAIKSIVVDETKSKQLYHLEKSELNNNTVVNSDSNKEKIMVYETLSDTYIVPDKYNTGAKGELDVITEPGIYCGVPIKVSHGLATLTPSMDSVPDYAVISNCDFTYFSEFLALKENLCENKKTIVFNNCNFGRMRNSRNQDNVNYIFNNCSFYNFYGSNSTLNNCYLGGKMFDCTNPFKNVAYNNCMFADNSHVSSEKDIHSDGVQIYAHEDTFAENIHFENCRFENPSFKFSKSTKGSDVNTCLGLMLEYNNADNVSWKHCAINGGGYSIYLYGKNGCTFSNAALNDIRVGASRRYGILYKNETNGAIYTNVHDTDSLFVGSVWKDTRNNIHISLTNDTNQERKLTIYTENGWKEYSIKACMTYDELVVDETTYKDMPFDININTQEKSDYIVCYDTTSPNETKQIRFVNWGSDTVFAYDYSDYIGNVIIEQ